MANRRRDIPRLANKEEIARVLLPKSDQESRTDSVRISDRHPSVQIQAIVQVNLRERLLNSASIGIPPSIPQNLLLDLWLNSGICVGVHAALHEFHSFLDQITTEVDFPRLNFSIDLEDLSADEIETLAGQLEAMMTDTVAQVLTRLTKGA